jgi:hypothetical protein
MSWTATSSKNHASNKTAGTSLTLPIAGAALSAGDVVVVSVAIDNSQTGDGDSALVSGLSCSNVTFTKVAEYTNGQGGSAAGATCAVWYGIASATVNVGTNITITHTSRTARAACYQAFSKTGSYVWLTATPVKFVGDGADPASQSLAGLGSGEHLAVMAIAHEAPNTLVWNSLTNYTAFNNTSGESGTSGSTTATNMTCRAGYRIFSGTSDTLDVAASATSDLAGIYLALQEGNSPPLVVDASSPAAVVVNNGAANAAATTASFTPPSGAMLVAVVSCDTGDDQEFVSDITITLSDSLGSTWTNRSERDSGDAGSNFGHSSIHTAVVTASQPMTVTATRAQVQVAESGVIVLKVFVITGQHASPIGAVNEGSATTNDTNATITTTAANSMILVGGTDWAANGDFTSSDLTLTTGTLSGLISYVMGYKPVATAGSQTMNLNAGGTASTLLNWTALEVLGTPAAATFTATATPSTGHTAAASTAAFSIPNRTASAAMSGGHTSATGGATFSPPVWTAVSALSVGHTAFAGTASSSVANRTASTALAVGHIATAIAATLSIPSRTASATVASGHVGMAGAGTFTRPVFTASTAHNTGAALLVAAASRTTATFTAAGAASTGPVTSAIAVAVAVPSFSAALNANSGHIGFVAAAVSGLPTRVAAASLTVRGPALAASAAFAARVYSASGGATLGRAAAHANASFVQYSLLDTTGIEQSVGYSKELRVPTYGTRGLSVINYTIAGLVVVIGAGETIDIHDEWVVGESTTVTFITLPDNAIILYEQASQFGVDAFQYGDWAIIFQNVSRTAFYMQYGAQSSYPGNDPMLVSALGNAGFTARAASEGISAAEMQARNWVDGEGVAHVRFAVVDDQSWITAQVSGFFDHVADGNSVCAPAQFVAYATFVPPAYVASMTAVINGVQLDCVGLFAQPVTFNPAWVSPSKVLVNHA